VTDGVDQESQPDVLEPGAQPDHLLVVLVISDFDAIARRALRFAEAHRPRSLVVLNVCTDNERTAALIEAWASRRIDVPLKCAQPMADDPDPVVNYVDRLRQKDPAAVVMVVLPVVAAPRWWQRPLHRLEDPTLPRRLSSMDRVLIAEVAWQLRP
jgi:hypothetical protein